MSVNTFGKNLRKAREALGLTQIELGKLTQLSQSAISSYERGERLNARELLRLAEVLKVTPEWLSGHNPKKRTNTASDVAEPMADIPFSFEWPFASVSPLAYYQLTEDERRMVESLAKSLVTLHQND